MRLKLFPTSVRDNYNCYILQAIEYFVSLIHMIIVMKVSLRLLGVLFFQRKIRTYLNTLNILSPTFVVISFYTAYTIITATKT